MKKLILSILIVFFLAIPAMAGDVEDALNTWWDEYNFSSNENANKAKADVQEAYAALINWTSILLQHNAAGDFDIWHNNSEHPEYEDLYDAAVFIYQKLNACKNAIEGDSGASAFINWQP